MTTTMMVMAASPATGRAAATPKRTSPGIKAPLLAGFFLAFLLLLAPHRLPGTEALYQECERTSRNFVYIKTHKTGSSTLANMFHRYGDKYGLHFAMPKDNTFYAWPMLMKQAILSSIWDYEKGEKFQILCSAHVRYLPEALEELVEKPQYVTVIRSPETHVRSSWSYWGISNHIAAGLGRRISLSDFLDNYDEYLRKGHPSDRTLLQNSQVFDLGLSNSPTRDQVEKLMDDMDDRFFVIITDRMDESLVMLKRRFCWELEDVVYMSLKQRTGDRHAKTAEQIREAEKIKKMNWADQLVYERFDAKLTELIAKDPGFEADLADFRALKQKMSHYCQKYSNFDEISHRVQLEGRPRIPEMDRLCHMLMLDSQSYSKHLKFKEGADFSDIECSTQGLPRRQALLGRVPGVPDDVLVNIFFNFAQESHFATAYEKKNPSSARLDDAFVHPRSFNFLVASTQITTPITQYEHHIVGHPGKMIMLMDPVQRFLRLWNEWDLENVLGVALSSFLDDSAAHKKTLGEFRYNTLLYGMANALDFRGSNPTPSPDEAKQLAVHLLRNIPEVYLAERWLESLVRMRRYMCAPRFSFLYPLSKNPNLPKGSTVTTLYQPISVPLEIERKIKALMPLEVAIYDRADVVFNLKLDRELHVDEEIAVFEKKIVEFTTACDDATLVMCGRKRQTPEDIIDAGNK